MNVLAAVPIAIRRARGSNVTFVNKATTLSATIAAPAASGATRSNGISTITTTAAHGFLAGQVVVISGVSDASFNGTFSILSVPTATTFTYSQRGLADVAAATAGNGTATAGDGVFLSADRAELEGWPFVYTNVANAGGFLGDGLPLLAGAAPLQWANFPGVVWARSPRDTDKLEVLP